jgi:hypothetical protein
MTVIKTSKLSKVVFILTLLTAFFWCLAQFVNIYHFAVIGVIFEILWLPMILLLFILPILSLIYWVKEKFYLKSLNLYSFTINLFTVLFVFLRN